MPRPASPVFRRGCKEKGRYGGERAFSYCPTLVVCRVENECQSIRNDILYFTLPWKREGKGKWKKGVG